MMLKFLGALIIIGTTSGIGWILAKQYSDRPRQLRQIRTALQSLESEIVYSLTPISEAAGTIAKQLPSPVKRMFANFAERLDEERSTAEDAWAQTLEAFWPHTALKNTEKEILLQFGSTLGKHDSDNQTKQIRLTLSHLEREEQEAKDIQLKYEKMTKSLGFLSGVLLVLLLF